MQDVNDDMDELFRRAANGYPLSTAGADWDKVFTALHSDGTKEVDIAEQDNFSRPSGKYPNVLLLLLLLAVPLVCVDYFLINNRIISAGTAKRPEGATSVEPIVTNNHGNITATNKNRQNSIERHNSNDGYRGKDFNKKAPDSYNLKTYKDEIARLVPKNKIDGKDIFLLPNRSLNKVEGSPVDKTIVESRDLDKQFYFRLKTDSITGSSSVPKKTNDLKNNSETVAGNQITEKKELAVKNKNKHALYAGLIAGPDISTIKLQPVNRTGFSVGLLIGYTVGKKLAVETGLMWDKKFYYTDGKYFNPKNSVIPSYININDVDGSCSMIEWPVNLSYTIKSFSKSFLTANAGISSYFMKNENYSYTFQRNGVENEWSLSYKNSSNNLFSIVNLGIGFNHSVSKSLMLRAEPYIKIPVTGIGMGRLPITSSGIFVILTKRKL